MSRIGDTEAGAGAPGAGTPSGPEEALSRLRQVLARVSDLRSAAAVLGWDQETYMPEAGIEGRSRQTATLQELAHERFVSDEVGELLERCAPLEEELDDDSDDARLIRVVRRDRERATRVPASLVAELSRATSLAQGAWRRARRESDFEAFRPHLEEVLGLVRRKADALGWEETPYDALLDEYEPEMRTSRVTALFTELRERLVPLVEAIAAVDPPDDSPLRRDFDEDAQWELGLRVIGDFGFDFERGRQDRSTHPFSTSFSVDDVRITTRVQRNWLPACLFGTLHEAGHALYEQGVDRDLERTTLAGGTSLGMHESQSRLWENLVGRSREFWEHYWPALRQAFPGVLEDVELEGLYAAINKVRPSLIRVEADEVTYNLHIMLRFDLERRLLHGELAVADLPEAWNAGMEEYLGIRPETDAEGVLQDVHWSLGAVGYFPTYTLGNLMSAQLFEAASREIDDLPGRIAAGEFGELLGWLRERIHRHGRKFTATELLRRVTGEGLSAGPWLRYVERKFGGLYGLDARQEAEVPEGH